ncbi:MAG: C-terminal binding protein [Hyphomicrobiaceae bacterium]|nr:C-terminal binding protein [Hyphomicrobiaceae bacterium]
MSVTVLYAEDQYPDETVEREVFGSGVTLMRRSVGSLSQLDAADCAEVDGLMILRFFVSREDMARFPKLKCIVRMGVGYDRIDRAAAAERNIIVCNVPDYGTTEVADHAIALALTLRRGIIHYHDTQRATPVAPWRPLKGPLVRRLGVQTFGIVGLGRIGTAAALRAKALGFRVMFFDPNLPNGSELAIGVERARTLGGLLEQTDVLSIHAPLTRDTRGLIGRPELAKLRQDAVLVNTARGPIVDIDAVYDSLKSRHLAAAGLDVVPVEPPVEPVPRLLAAYRACEPWLLGRLVVTPHAAYYSPQADRDTRVKAAETMRAALLSNRPQNVITPDMD